MELEFDRDQLHCYETVLDTTLCQEETMESIVPDACPDILRIIDCCGQTLLTGKQARDGLAVANGTIRVTILYHPEGGGGLRRMEVSLPFACQAEAPGLTDQGSVMVSPRLRRLEARALNPRKVLLRVDLAIDILACQPKEYSVCCGVIDPDSQSVCQQTVQDESYLRTAVQERPFMFSEEVRLPGNNGEGAQILASRATAICNESKLIGSKLIFKGNVELQLLLQESGGNLISHQEQLPFSQVMEVSDVGEDGDCQMDVTFTDLTCVPTGEDGRSLEVSMELLAQAQVWCRRPITLLQDLYSTSLTTEVQTIPQKLTQLMEQSIRPQSVREVMETGGMVRNVADSWIALGDVTQSREGNQLVLSAQPQVTVLYQDENEEIQSIQRAMPISCRLDCPQDVTCHCSCRCPGEVFAAPAAGGVEVRFTMEFCCMTLSSRNMPVVKSAKTGEPRSAGDAEQPSVVLRMAAPDEAMWDIAKAYGTTMQQIMQANELEEGMLPGGMMLLIPRVR